MVEIKIPADEKRVLLGLLFWNPDNGCIDIDGPSNVPAEEILALLKGCNLGAAECPKRGS